MVRYNIDEISDDMILGESIFLPSGELLLSAGYRIKERYRQRLKQLGYSNVLIELEGTEGVRPETTVCEQSQREMNKSVNASSKELETAFNKFRHRSNLKVKEIIKENRQHLSNFIMSSGMAKALEQFVDEIMSQSSIVLNLSAIQHTQPEALSHVLNVTITALCIGKKYKYSYEEMKQLGIGALNYDLGMIALSPDLLEKRRKNQPFSEEEQKQYNQHPLFGYLMLNQNHLIPSTSAAVALQHHEYENGSGFPQGLRGDNRPPLKDFSRQNMIHRFAEIVAVADTYDSLLSGRYNCGQKMEVKDVMKHIITMSSTELNSDIVKTLIAIVPIYPVGARIRIVNAPTSQLVGYVGAVAKDNKENIEKPQIILFQTRNRQKIKPVLIDLAKHKGFELELIA